MTGITTMPAVLTGRLCAAALTYREAGQTAGVLPRGYHHLHRSTVIGSGSEAFTNAAEALLTWRMHLRAGLRVTASSAIAAPGAVVRLTAGAGLVRISAPCRVIYPVNEPHRRGFGYCTLPGHPGRGEEAFMVTQHHDGTVTAAITASPSPRSSWPRPLARPRERSRTTSPRAPSAHSPADHRPARFATPIYEPSARDAKAEPPYCRVGVGAAVVAVVSRGSDGLALEPPAGCVQPGLLTTCQPVGSSPWGGPEEARTPAGP